MRRNEYQKQHGVQGVASSNLVAPTNISDNNEAGRDRRNRSLTRLPIETRANSQLVGRRTGEQNRGMLR
jgi:hypothetical protein